MSTVVVTVIPLCALLLPALPEEVTLASLTVSKSGLKMYSSLEFSRSVIVLSLRRAFEFVGVDPIVFKG